MVRPLAKTMIMRFVLALLFLGAAGCDDVPVNTNYAEPLGRGPYSVASTNLEVAAEYMNVGDDAMHGYLLGRATEAGQPRFLTDILQYPESAYVVDVPIPEQEIYGPAQGLTLPVVSYITFPSGPRPTKNRYAFPYHDAQYGEFEDMLQPGEAPKFASDKDRYPLVIISHGATAHGIYDVRRAHNIASHGYIVVVLTYGDDRAGSTTQQDRHIPYLRPFLTKAVLDALLQDETFGPHIAADNIGISGHSFGGFTALAVAGGPYLGDTATVMDRRIKAASIAAPWVGGNYGGSDFYAFGPENAPLDRVAIPVISFFGTNDKAIPASFILQAMKLLSGPTYVIELVDQPHIFEQGSWDDRDNWELLFFSAYLKHDPEALAMLKSAQSMRGGGEDIQLFDYQKLIDNE